MRWDTSEWFDQEDSDAVVMLSGKIHHFCQGENYNTTFKIISRHE